MSGIHFSFSMTQRIPRIFSKVRTLNCARLQRCVSIHHSCVYARKNGFTQFDDTQLLQNSRPFHVERKYSACYCRDLLADQFLRGLRCELTNFRSMAGHSKWQNVKNVKTEKDRAKGLLCDRFARMARYAVREKGPDPKLNERLRDVIEKAKEMNVPFSTIEGAMKKASSGKINLGLMEIAGPGGCFIVLEYETDNVSTTRHDIKFIIRKYNAGVMQGEGKWRAIYDQKGIIKVIGKSNGEEQWNNSEKALDSAIEAGAEDVQLRKDDDDQQLYLEFICDPADLHAVKKALEEMYYKIEDAFIGFIPHTTAQLTSEDADEAGNLLAELEDREDVTRVYENIQ